MNQQVVEELARNNTKPRQGASYQDSPEIKQAFKQAKISKTAGAWTRALNMRKQARKKWETERLKRASEGDWKALQSCRPRRSAGWDVHFASEQQGDPHEAVHAHLASVYRGSPPRTDEYGYSGEVNAFTLEEMRTALASMKAGKAVGTDLTSRELLVGLVETEGGEAHLLEWFNRILVSQQVPKQWNEPLLLVIPTVTLPTKCKQLRPLAMGSAVGKLFAKMLLARTMWALKPRTAAQCAAPQRQTSDYVFAVHRMFELCREWGSPVCAVKVDLNKAFDCVNRGVLLPKLSEWLGACAEMGCWAALLSDVQGELQTPWGRTPLNMPSGIKQGAVESPAMFGFIAELALEETKTKQKWSSREELFEGMNEEECLFMDDGVLWCRELKEMQARLREYANHLRVFGLTINLAKCQLYCGPHCPGPHRLRIGDTLLEASEHLEVMGLQFRVGVAIMELITPLAERARQKFWELQHIFRTRGHLHQRIRTMQRTVAQSGLWCLSALPPDKGAMGYLNSVQCNIIVWMMRLSKGKQEDWGSYRMRVWRAAGAALHRAGQERWSTMWLRRHWTYSGHRARGVDRECPVISSIFDTFRDRQWWEAERQKKNGLTHVKHFPRLMQMESKMDTVTKGPWRQVAVDRGKWRELETVWVDQEDLPWASGRQQSITY